MNSLLLLLIIVISSYVYPMGNTPVSNNMTIIEPHPDYDEANDHAIYIVDNIKYLVTTRYNYLNTITYDVVVLVNHRFLPLPDFKSDALGYYG